MSHQRLQPCLDLVQSLFVVRNQHDVPVSDLDHDLGQFCVHARRIHAGWLVPSRLNGRSRLSVSILRRPGQQRKRREKRGLGDRQLQRHLATLEQRPRPLAQRPLGPGQCPVLVLVEVLEYETTQPDVPLHFVDRLGRSRIYHRCGRLVRFLRPSGSVTGRRVARLPKRRHTEISGGSIGT